MKYSFWYNIRPERGDRMKYSIYARNYLKRKIKNNNHNISDNEAEKQAEEEFKNILLESFYQTYLAKLSDNDPLRKLELEEEIRFLDLHPLIRERANVLNPHNYLYHGVRFDEDHKKFESILRDKKIKCANKTDFHYIEYSDNCNEGEYISLINYTGEEYDLEFKTFIEENTSFIISPKLNPLKCKYLPFDEWYKIKEKLPTTKHRYSYARNEYQHPDYIPFEYIVGILYPMRYYNHINGFRNTKTDLIHIKELLMKYDLEYLPLLDPTNYFRSLEDELSDDMYIRRGKIYMR